MKARDLTGRRVGYWTVIGPAKTPAGNRNRFRYWLCRCRCGTERPVICTSITHRRTKSCGCSRGLTKSQISFLLCEHQAGVSVARIARRLGCSEVAIYWRLKRNGIGLHQPQEARVTQAERKGIIAAYRAGKRVRELANLFRKKSGTINGVLRRGKVRRHGDRPKPANTLTKESFVRQARAMHGDKYDYSEIEYARLHTRASIICPVHGRFLQELGNHLQGKGCRKCAIAECADKKRLSAAHFVKRAIQTHGQRYGYGSVKYITCDTKVEILCPKHGVFWQTPYEHIAGCGCPKCGGESRSVKKTRTLAQFITEAHEAHDDQYDYSRVVYTNSKHHVTIICKKHGPFRQAPENHVCGNGCPVCKESRGEKSIARYLRRTRIAFVRQHRFPDCRHKCTLPFDFAIPLPSGLLLIEFQGEQHFRLRFFGGKTDFADATKELQLVRKRDRIKRRYARKHGIPLLAISYRQFNRIEAKLSAFLAKHGLA